MKSLPSAWPEAHLSHLAAIPITNGLGEAAADGDDTWPRYIRTTDIATLHSLDPTKRVTLPPDVARSAFVAPGDVLLTAAGSLGTSYLVDAKIGAACFAGYLVRFRADPRRAVPRYVAWWTQSKHHLDQLAIGAVRSTIDNFSAGKFRSMSIPVPPIEEQRAIADFLDEQTSRIDTLIDKQTRLITTLRERRHAVQAGLIESHSARIVRLKFRAWVTVGIVVTPAAWYVDAGGVPSIRGTDIAPGSVDLERLVRISDEGHLLHQKSALEVGDVVVVRTGQAGAAAVVPPALAGANAIDVLIVRHGPDLDPGFLEMCLNGAATTRLVDELSVGALQGHLNVSTLRGLSIPDISLEAQRHAVATWDAYRTRIDALVAKAEEHIALAKERRAALITAAVTGQIDVRTAGRAAQGVA